jgi:flagellar hook assembly protein FlgD
VTFAPGVKDTTSGVYAITTAVDGAAAVRYTSGSITVDGDGSHTVTVAARDKAGNLDRATIDFVIDTTAPVIEVPAPGETVPTVTPNGDGLRESVALPFTVNEPGTVTAVVTDASAVVVRTITVPAAAGEGSLPWDGRNAKGAPVADGRYTVTFTPTDTAGNPGAPVTDEVDAYGALKALTRTPATFFPQDGDALAAKTKASFTLLAPATVSIRVVDRDGTTVRTGMTDKALSAGPVSWSWNGKNNDGAFVPRGIYRIIVGATNGTQSASQTVTVATDAFRIRTSVTTATRGKSLTVTAVTVEALSTTPKLTILQPGLASWKVLMKKTSSTTWVAVITPKRGGKVGTLRLTILAKDIAGGTNTSVARMALK